MHDLDRARDMDRPRGATEELEPVVHRPPVSETDLAGNWLIELGALFLNHGSFGACPREVLANSAVAA